MLSKKWSIVGAVAAFAMAGLFSACSDSSSSSGDDPKGEDSGYDQNSTEAGGAYVMITEVM